MRRVDPAKFEEKRQQILEAARKCFLRDGFRGASISDICRAARMSPGHLYHYFESKEALVKAIVELGLEQAAGVFNELGNQENVVEALVSEIDRRLNKDRRRHGSFVLEMLAEGARNPAIADVVHRRERARRELLGRLLRAGQERGQIDPSLDPETAAAIVSSILETVSQQTIRDPSFDVKRGADMLKILLTRFLGSRAVNSKGVRRLSEDLKGR